MGAMHHGAVMEGSWGAEADRGARLVADADAALALLRAELQPGDVVLVKASNSVGLGALADALVADAGPRGRAATRAKRSSPTARGHGRGVSR